MEALNSLLKYFVCNLFRTFILEFLMFLTKKFLRTDVLPFHARSCHIGYLGCQTPSLHILIRLHDVQGSRVLFFELSQPHVQRLLFRNQVAQRRLQLDVRLFTSTNNISWCCRNRIYFSLLF